MRNHLKSIASLVATSLLCVGIAHANVPKDGNDGLLVASNQGGVPPGLAKKGGVPPGLAKKFGATVPARAYIAVDPKYDDRAWFLIDGRWVLQQGFDSQLRVEVRSLFTLPPIPEPPPIPLPSAAVSFRVVLFQ